MPLADENLRRYYLDAMGIQCWQELVSSEPETEEAAASDMDVAGTVIEQDGKVTEGSTFQELQQQITSCQQCAVHQGYPQLVAGRGAVPADILVLMLAPSMADAAASMICSGEQHVLLTKMLAAIQLDIGDVYITSLLKYTVPESHTIRPDEVAHGLEHLKQQLTYIQPGTILVMGDITARCLLQKNIGLDDFRATNEVQEYTYEGIPLLFSYSPAELIDSPKDKRKAWEDLQLLQKLRQ